MALYMKVNYKSLMFLQVNDRQNIAHSQGKDLNPIYES